MSYKLAKAIAAGNIADFYNEIASLEYLDIRIYDAWFEALSKNNIEIISMLSVLISNQEIYDTEYLFMALRFGDWRTIDGLITMTKYRLEQYYLRTPLNAAIIQGNYGLCKLLVLTGSNVNHKDGYGDSPLLRAVTTGHSKIINFLLNIGAEYNTLDSEGETLLFKTVFAKRKILDLLLKYPIDINKRNKRGNTVLHNFCHYIHSKTAHIRLLLEKGAQVNETNENGETPLFFAIRRKNLEVVRLLIEKGASVHSINFYEDSVLMVSASVGATKITQLLIEKGAYVQFENHNSLTALWKSFEQPNTKTTKLLLENGADVLQWGRASQLHSIPTWNYSLIAEEIIRRDKDEGLLIDNSPILKIIKSNNIGLWSTIREAQKLRTTKYNLQFTCHDILSMHPSYLTVIIKNKIQLRKLNKKFRKDFPLHFKTYKKRIKIITTELIAINKQEKELTSIFKSRLPQELIRILAELSA